MRPKKFPITIVDKIALNDDEQKFSDLLVETMKKMGWFDLLPVRLWLGEKLFDQESWKTVRVSPGRLIKGPCHSSELEAMRYVTEHTSVPVPKLHRVHERPEGIFLEMEFVKGSTLENAWADNLLSTEQKKGILQELTHIVKQLRDLQPPEEGLVGSTLLKNFRDVRIGSREMDPFENHDDFHTLLRGNIRLEQSAEIFGTEVSRCHSRQYRTKFTHADLAPRNVLVSNGKIAAIIDWEFAGWYPEYWEYTKAHYAQLYIPDYYEHLPHVLPRYDEELTAERTLWRLCKEPGD